MHGKDNQLGMFLMSSANQKVSSRFGSTVNSDGERDISSSSDGSRQCGHVHENRLLCLLKQGQSCLEEPYRSCSIDIDMLQQQLGTDLGNLGFGRYGVVSCVCDDEVEVGNPLIFDAGDGGEAVGV